MKKIILVLIVIAGVNCAYADYQQAITQAKDLFKQARYGDGLDSLHTALRVKDITPLQRAHVIIAMAEFYEEFVGDTRKASGFYKQVVRADIGADNPLKSLAQERLSRLKSLGKKYRQQNKLLSKARVGTSGRPKQTEIAEQIEQLLTLIEQNPEYYKLAEAYYYLGTNYAVAEQYRKATEALNKAVELKPGMNFHLPVTPKLGHIHTKWVRAVINKTTWGTIGVVLILTMIVFYASRPWRWLQLKHVGIFLLAVLLWMAASAVAFKLIGKTFHPKEKFFTEANAQLPAFIDAAPKSPGSEVVHIFFLYALAGVLGTCVFSMATSRIKYKAVALLLNFVVGLALMISITSIFYLRHCPAHRFASDAKEGLVYYAKGSICFLLHDIEPFILTNPKAYPNLSMNNVGEPHIKEWLERYCTFDSDDKKNK